MTRATGTTPAQDNMIERLLGRAERDRERARRDLERAEALLDAIAALPGEPDVTAYDPLVVVLEVSTARKDYRYAALHAGGAWWLTGRTTGPLTWEQVLATVLNYGGTITSAWIVQTLEELM